MLVKTSKHQKSFSYNYILSEVEYRELTRILFNDNIDGYSTFIIVLLKELDGDISKALRVLNIGVNGNRKVIPVSLYNKLIRSIKEAIILSTYEQYIEEDGFVSLLRLSRLDRYKLAYIDRQTIIRTFRKYKIRYNSRN